MVTSEASGRRGRKVLGPPDRRRHVAEQQRPDDRWQRRFAAGGPDDDVLDAVARVGRTERQHADLRVGAVGRRRAHRIVLQQNDARGMMARPPRQAERLRAATPRSTVVDRRAAAEHDQVRHHRARHRRLPRRSRPERRQIGLDPLRRRRPPRRGRSEWPPSPSRRFDQAVRFGGPHSPAAGYVAQRRLAIRSSHRSRIGMTHRHAASTASRRMNSVGSPAMTSSSSRS